MASRSDHRSEGVREDVIRQIRADLLARERELSRHIDQELDDIRSSAEGHHPADMDDLGGDANDEETPYQILELEATTRAQIDWALERIDVGTYGQCEDCDRPINEERLRALPFATRCIDCKRREEREDMRRAA